MAFKKLIFTFLILCFINVFYTGAINLSKKNSNFTCGQNCLMFADEKDFIKNCKEIIEYSLTNRKKIEKLKNFYSMMDAFDKLDMVNTKEEYDQFVKKNKDFIAFIKVKTKILPLFTTIQPKINLIFACLVNTEGEVKIGDKTINLIKDKTYNKKLELLLRSTIIPEIDSDTSDIVSIPEYLTYFIPMCKLVLIPVIYPTKYFKTNIDGEDIVIQVWKGYYPGILGYPNGVGAEVGLYRPLSWTKSIWMPDYRNPKKISFKLISKNNNQLVLSVSKKTWWLNSWEKNYSKLSLKGKDYILKYSVADSVWVW